MKQLNIELRKACDGKSQSLGGLNVPAFKIKLAEIFPHRAEDIQKASRKIIEKICHEELKKVEKVEEKVKKPEKILKIKQIIKRGCVKQTGKKYTERKSPPFPANECCGEIMKGNDENLYISKSDKKGICRWHQHKEPVVLAKEKKIVFSQLPVDMVLEILSKMELAELKQMCRVSPRIRRLCQEKKLIEKATVKGFQKIPLTSNLEKQKYFEAKGKSINLSDKNFRLVHIPKLQNLDLNKETGLEQKIGGNIPFFSEGDNWPMKSGKPYAFVAQFADPRDDKKYQNKLLQVFMPDLDEIEEGVGEKVAYVKVVDLLKPLKQIIIPQPKNVPNQNLLKPLKIVGWIRRYEVSIDILDNKFYQKYETSFLEMEDYEIKFSPNQKLPPNYKVIWSDAVEHYMWWINDDLYGPICCNRFMARRLAWSHYRSNPNLLPTTSPLKERE